MTAHDRSTETAGPARVLDVETLRELLAEYSDTEPIGVREFAMSGATLERLREKCAPRPTTDPAPAAARLWGIPVILDEAIATGEVELRPKPMPTLDDVAEGRVGMGYYLARCLAAEMAQWLDDDDDAFGSGREGGSNG